MSDFEIVEPRSLAEAFSYLDAGDPAVRPVGGATALMLLMKSRLFRPTRLVSLRKLEPRLDAFEMSVDGASLNLGAMTTFAALEYSPLIAQRFPVVTRAMNTLANVRVRNVATIGGNLAHGDPHLDLPPIWAALGVEVVVASASGERVVAVEDLYRGYYETTLRGGELITRLRVPVRANSRATYVKVTTRSAHDWPALGLAIAIRREGDRVTDLRAFVSAATDRVFRLSRTEAMLRDVTITDALLARAGEAAVAEAPIEGDIRGTAAYKKELLRVHLARAVKTLMAE